MRTFWATLTGDRRVNLRALLILSVTLVTFVGTVYLVHGWQMRQNAHGLYEQAELAEREGHAEQAAQYLEHYLGLAPTDDEALAKYGLLLNRLAKNDKQRSKALDVLEQAVRRDGGRQDLRREVAKLARQLGRFPTAKEHLDILLKEAPEDPELLHDYARCETGLLNYDEAAKWYNRAIKKAPTRSEISLEYATLLRQHLKLAEQGDDVVEQMVQLDPRGGETRLRAAAYYRQFGQLKEAWRHVRFGLDNLGAPSEELLLMAGDMALALKEFDEARQYFEQGRKRFPQDLRMGQGLARLELRKGDAQKALEYLQPSLRSLPELPEEQWQLANLLIGADAFEPARELIQRLQKEGQKVLAELLEARLQMKQDRWGEASQRLEKLRRTRLPLPELTRHLNVQLAECYDHLANPDQKLAAWGRAVDTDPTWLPGRAGLAAALAALGQLDLAIAEYRKLLSQAPELNNELARLLLARTLRQQKAQRDWTDLEGLLGRLTPAGKATPAAQLLRAEILASREKWDEARKLVEALRDQDPKQFAPWMFLAGLAQRQGQADAVAKLLAEAERQVGKRVEWPLVRASQFLAQGQVKAREQLPRLLPVLEQFQGADWAKLAQGLAQAFANAGDPATARRLLARVAEMESGNLGVRFVLFEEALREKEVAEARRLLEQLRRIEGGEGALTAFAEGVLQLSLAQGGDPKALAAAQSFLARAAALRPSWPRALLAEGFAFDLAGQKDKALEKYKAGLQRGGGNLAALKRAVQLLHERRQFDEAQALLRKLPEQALTLPELGRLDVQLTLRNATGPGQDTEARRREALEAARKTVAAGTKDYRELLWLGQVEYMVGDKKQAEKAYRRACELNDQVPETWASLILFLSTTDRPKAEAELERARQRLPKDKAALVLAPCLEALGQADKAEQQHLTTLAAHPRNAATLWRAAAFYTRTGQPAKAEPLLRKILHPEIEVPAAAAAAPRRALALVLAQQGGYQRFQEAEALLKQNAKSNGDTPENRMMTALVKAGHPAHRQEAIRLVESLAVTGASLPPARFLLARLYEVDGKWQKAEAHLRILLEVDDRNPVYLTFFISGLLREKRADEAQPWVDKLAEAAPKNVDTIGLRIGTLKGRSETAAAIALVQAYVKEKDARLNVAAHWFEMLDQVAAAEKTYRAYVAAEKNPTAVLVFAQFLARHKRLDEALNECERAWKTCPPEAVAAASVLALHTVKGGAAQQERVELAVRKALAAHPQSVGVRTCLAELQIIRDKHDEAIAMYRKMLEQDPANPVVLNNLAFLLAVTDRDPAEALQLINAALSRVGQVAPLLDTRAVVYLKRKQANLAVQDMEQATAQAGTPAYYCHLAKAQHLAGKRTAATLTLRKAIDLGLRLTDLQVLERPELQRLATTLGLELEAGAK